VIESSKRLLGTLVAVPLVIVVFGTEWSWTREFSPASVQIERAGEEDRSLSPDAAPLSFFIDGAETFHGQRLSASEAMAFSFDRPRERVTLVLQAEADDEYRVSGSADGVVFEPLWSVPSLPGGGLRTRRSPLLPSKGGIQLVRIKPEEGDQEYVVSGLRLVEHSRFVHVLLIPVIFGLWAGLHGLRRLRHGERFASGVLSLWQRFDAGVSGLLVFAILFQIPATVIVHLLWLLGIVGSIALLHRLVGRWGLKPMLLMLAAIPVGVILFLTVYLSVLLAQFGEAFELDVDHRLVPGGEINEDRVRFRGTASRLQEEDYVLVFLGDSFTYGSHVEYWESYPYVLEEMLSALDCAPPVRVANFGWPSSSPLLSYRLLRDIGHKYKPDLLIYGLDMTDFHDDLRYEADFERYGDQELPKYVLMSRFVFQYPGWFRRGIESLLPWRPLRENPLSPRARSPEPRSAEAAANEAVMSSSEQGFPRARYFVTNLPLEKSIDGIERGVVRNLARIFEYGRTDLKSSMLLVILPRGFQYSDRETPRNWEAGEYQEIGPFVREPFRYFEEAREKLPYPVFSLLPAFEESGKFPLYLEDDPHWNAEGHRVAAAGLAEYLVRNQLVPCAPP
jgi:hypothetical protein